MSISIDNISVVGTEDEDCNNTEGWEWVYTTQPAYMATICVLGLLGNSFVLCVFYCQRKHGTVADIYLGNLAVADLAMLACLPFWVVNVAREFDWPFGELMCKAVNTVITVNYHCSVMFLVVVSVDRYVALVKPMTFGRKRHAAWAKRLCLAVWVLGFLFSLPVLLFRTVKSVPGLGVHACVLAYPHQSWRLQRNVTINVVGFLVPLPVFSFCCFHMVAVLHHDPKVTGLPRRRSERRSACLVLVVLAAYMVCFLPHQVVRFLDTLDYFEVFSGCSWWNGLDIGTQIATYLAYGNSAFNPFLYVIVGKHFRRRAGQVFKRLLQQSVQDKASVTTNMSSIIKLTERISVDKLKTQSLESL